jgi:hypothetical protein
MLFAGLNTHIPIIVIIDLRSSETSISTERVLEQAIGSELLDIPKITLLARFTLPSSFVSIL